MNAASRVLSVVAVGAGVAVAQPTTRVCLDSQGREGNAFSRGAALSDDGRLVVFSSQATNLVAGDTNHCEDVFVHDRCTGTTARLSVDAAGVESNGASYDPVISADGRYVAFESAARNLVPGDNNNRYDVFVRDLVAGSIRRISVSTSGNEGNGDSAYASISADGSAIAFSSSASNLVGGDGNAAADVFVCDLATGSLQRASVSSAGGEANGASSAAALSRDGRFVAFASAASNLVSGDGNAAGDVFVHDLLSGTTLRASVNQAGDEANGGSYCPAISGDGRFVAFSSEASNLIGGDKNHLADVFVHDRDYDQNGVFDEPFGTMTVRASAAAGGDEADGASEAPAISADGRYVTFESAASNLVVNDDNQCKDVFVRDLRTGLTSCASVSALGAAGNAASLEAAVSGNGRVIAFTSYASNLVDGDGNAAKEVFVDDRITVLLHGTPQYQSPVDFLVSNATGEQGNIAIVMLSASGTSGFTVPDGRTVPLTFDWCTQLGLELMPFLSAVIDAEGAAATPTFRFPEMPSGFTIYAAALTVKPNNAHIVSISGPTSFTTQ
ncbi:MAG: hypothetical protein U1E76_23375 [Planctomycetota bacterium]